MFLKVIWPCYLFLKLNHCPGNLTEEECSSFTSYILRFWPALGPHSVTDSVTEVFGLKGIDDLTRFFRIGEMEMVEGICLLDFPSVSLVILIQC